MSATTIQRAFIAGELSPAYGARADLRAYAAGLALCQNCLVRREGGVQNRPGTKYVATAGDSSKAVRLVPFIFEAADQTYVLEFGDAYVRFFWHGAPVVSGMSPYELVSPYAAADLAALKFAQSTDTILITHPSYAPRELRRTSHTSWAFATVTTAPSLSAPASPSGTAGASGTRTFTYYVTALKATTYEESVASVAIVLSSAAAPTVDAPHALAWTAVSGAAEYNVYLDPFGNGLAGYIGKAVGGTSFNDPGFAPDFTVTPPVSRTLFASSNNYPAACAHYQQRRLYGRSNTDPETVWGSRTGAYHNFAISTPLQDDDAIEFVIAALELMAVHHLVALTRLLVLTDRGVWLVQGDETGTIIPAAINPDLVSYYGSHPTVRPVAVGDTLVYAQALGTSLRELRFDVNASVLGGRDLFQAAGHLLEGHTIAAVAFQRDPQPILWVVRDDGVVLSGTYLPDEQICAWARHTFANGTVEDVCVVPRTSAGEDEVYFVVKRTIDGSDVRYIEQLASRVVDFTSDDTYARTAIFLDACGTYDSTPASTITGIDHLEGEVVGVVADGEVIYDGDPDGDDAATYTVTNGEITLPAAASIVQIGLAILEQDLETLTLDADQTNIRDRRKNVKAVTLSVVKSDPIFQAGPDADSLDEARLEADQDGSPVDGAVEIPLQATWTQNGKVHIRHSRPAPWHVTAIMPTVAVGG